MSDQPQFDNILFKRVLSQAQGTRSIEQFAKDAGISPSFIKKHYTGSSVRPTIRILNKIANATSLVSYESLLEAAGYGSPLRASNHSDDSMTARLLLSAILYNLHLSGHEWTDSNEYTRYPFTNLSVYSNEVKDSKWFFDFLPVSMRSVKDAPFDSTELLNKLYLDLFSSDMDSSWKLSIVTNSADLFTKVSESGPKLVSLPMSVILVDTIQMTVKKEFTLPTSVILPSEDIRVITAE